MVHVYLLHRCVLTSLVTNDGRFASIWNDHGAGANRDITLYSNANIDSDVGLDSGTFTAFASYSTPHGKPNLLKSGTAKQHSSISLSTSSQVALVVFQTTNLQTIWKDSGSGADSDFSSHRVIESKNTYSLGDIGLRSHSLPSYGLEVKEVRHGALAVPIGFRQRWSDQGSDADQDVTFMNQSVLWDIKYLAMSLLDLILLCLL